MFFWARKNHPWITVGPGRRPARSSSGRLGRPSPSYASYGRSIFRGRQREKGDINGWLMGTIDIPIMADSSQKMGLSWLNDG